MAVLPFQAWGEQVSKQANEHSLGSSASPYFIHLFSYFLPACLHMVILCTWTERTAMQAYLTNVLSALKM